MNMARLNIELPDKVMLEFRKMVLDEHGSLKGEMAKEIELAMRDYLCKKGRQGNFNALRLPILA